MITLYSEPFKELLDTFFETPRIKKSAEMNTRVSTNNDDYKIVIPVPGLTKDDLTIKVKDGILHISYEMKDTDNQTYSFINSFKKSYHVPDDVDEKHIKGSVENGVLEIVLPKSKKKVSERLIELS